MDVIERMPCTIRLLPIPKPSAGFYDFGDYERLVEAAKSSDPTAYLIVLLGGDAGRRRCGEMMAIEWRDVDLQKLEQPKPSLGRGDILETADGESAISNP